MAIKRSNDTWFDSLPDADGTASGQGTFQNPITDQQARREKPKRHDEREDFVEMNNEKGHDSDVSNRYSFLPLSVCVYALEDLCTSPSLEKVAHVRGLLSLASSDVISELKDYIDEQLDLIEWDKVHLSSTASLTKQSVVTNLFVRYYLLSRFVS